MQHREVEDCIERSVVESEIRDVAFHNSYPISIFGKSISGSVHHIGIEIDRSDPIGAKVLDLTSNAFARPTANVEDVEPLGTPAQRDELWDHASP